MCSKRDEWGRLFEKICKACPVSDIMAFLNQRLSAAVAKAQQEPDKVSNWIAIDAILVCITEVTRNLTQNDLQHVSSAVQLVFQLPAQYLALKRTSSYLLMHVSLPMTKL